MTREQAEQRALELYPDEYKTGFGFALGEGQRKAYLQCFDDMQKDVKEWREAAQKVVMYHREKFHESTQLNKCERFNKAVCQLEKTLSK